MALTPDELEPRLQQYIVTLHEGILKHGWMIQGVFGTAEDPGSFSYTVGLTDKEQPELFLDTLAPTQAQSILNTVAKLVTDGTLVPSDGVSFDAEFSCQFRWHGPIDGKAAACHMAYNLYDDKVTVFQVLWPDTDGLFPGDEGYNAERFPQRLISYPPDFCRHCDRLIVNEDGGWIDPQATDDDSVWRETCDSHDTFTAEHEPTERN